MIGKALKKKPKNAKIVGMSSYKNIFRFTGVMIVILAIWTLHPSITLAQQLGQPQSLLPTGMEATIANIASKIIAFLNIGIWILFILLNYVLDPNFIFDLGGGSFMDMLNQIWQLSRDLMNVIFAFALVGAAIYTIIMANKEFAASHAPKFLLVVILVNFSWFVPRVILDVANVTTSTIYGIPSLLFQNGAQTCSYKTSVNEGPNFCTVDIPANPAKNLPAIYKCSCRMVVDAKFFMSQAFSQTLTPANGWKCFGSILCVQEQAWSANINGSSAILNGLIINHAHLATMASVPGPIDTTNIGAMTQFLIKEMLIVLIHIAMFLPLLAMFIAFLIRIPILWLTIAFMPFFFFEFVVSGVKGLDSLGGMTKKIGEEFMKAAFLPAMVAMPLSIGFILVNAGDQVSTSSMNNISIRLIDSIGNFFELFWWLMTLGVLWAGVFMALEKAGGYYQKTSSSIKGYGEAFGKLAVQLPLSLPIIPGPGGGQSLLQLGRNMNPHNLSNTLTGPNGIPNTLNQIGGIGGHGQAFAAGHAGGGLKDPQLDQIHTDLETLKTVLNDTRKSKTEKQAAIATFEGRQSSAQGLTTTFKIDVKNPKQSLNDFMNGLNASGNKNLSMAKVRKSISEFK